MSIRIPVALALLATIAAASDVLADGNSVSWTCAGGPPAEIDWDPRRIAPFGDPDVVLEPFETNDDDLTTLRWNRVQVSPMSSRLPIRIASNTVGFLAFAENPMYRGRIGIDLIDERGRLVACPGCADAPAIAAARRSRGTVQIPSTDRNDWEIRPGNYELQLRPLAEFPFGDEPVHADVTVAFRSDFDVVLRRTIDLNFVYLPDCGLTTALAQSSPVFADFLDEIDEILAPAGLSIGDVTHVDFDRERYSQIASFDEAYEMFRKGSAAVGQSRALNVFCLESFVPPLSPAVGLSGGIPGPVHSGSNGSGVAMRTSTFLSCPSCVGAFASLFAHELGHFLGLYHTTEASIDTWDPLSDTPECREGTLDGCPDWGNVMFPVVGADSREWTPAQIAILQAHPLVRSVPVLSSPLTAPPTRAEERIFARPNPFREGVTLEFSRATVGADGSFARVYNVRGRVIRDLAVDGGRLHWDGFNRDGEPSPAGIYFIHLPETNAPPVRVIRVP